MGRAAVKKEKEIAIIEPANIVKTVISIRGTSPLLQNKFSNKAKAAMMKAMTTTKAEKKSKNARELRDFDEDFQQAQYISTAGWNGIPCSSFRNAMIAACRTVNMVMTQAKMSIFVLADGFDSEDGTPLVRIVGDRPERNDAPVRLPNGSFDIRIRPMWREWECKIQVTFDADMVTPESVVNLLDRAGKQVGVGEGRPFSRNSCGQGYGTFEVVETETEKPRKAKKA